MLYLKILTRTASRAEIQSYYERKLRDVAIDAAMKGGLTAAYIVKVSAEGADFAKMIKNIDAGDI